MVDAACAVVKDCAVPFGDVASADVKALLDRVGDARVVLVGEASHGSSEFYRMRAHITRALIERRGFSIVAIEGDWPDAAHLDARVRHRAPPPGEAFARFPRWMWRNREVQAFVAWLRAHNEGRHGDDAVSFAGLDLYSLFASRDAVVGWLDAHAPEVAKAARARYACLTPWQDNLDLYGHAAVIGAIDSCEAGVVALLTELLERRLHLAAADGDSFFDAVMNARLVAAAERYYREMFHGRDASWNLRDTHMMETLDALLEHRGPRARAVGWAHNSHVGDARAMAAGERGQITLGQLCRERYGDDDVFLVGFGTDHGTVAAASDWHAPVEIKRVRPALAGSYERLCHETGVAAFQLALRGPHRPELVDELTPERLERAIGVVYRPETERFSHYFDCSLPQQFDWYVWIDETRAVSPLDDTAELSGVTPETFPSGL